jgi:ribosomal-protein-alanine N-acetyltransferase
MTIIQTPRLILRDYREDDLQEMHRLWSCPVAMYYLDDILTTTIEGSEKYLQTGMANADGRYFCVAEKQRDIFIGSVGYTIQAGAPGKTVHMGYMMLPEYHGRGYMSEAVPFLLDFAFTRDGVTRITTGCHEENTASRKIIEKCGFALTATKTVLHYGIEKIRLEYELKNHAQIKRQEILAV